MLMFLLGVLCTAVVGCIVIAGEAIIIEKYFRGYEFDELDVEEAVFNALTRFQEKQLENFDEMFETAMDSASKHIPKVLESMEDAFGESPESN